MMTVRIYQTVKRMVVFFAEEIEDCSLLRCRALNKLANETIPAQSGSAAETLPVVKLD